MKIPRNAKMTKKYVKERELLPVTFDKGNGFCVMKKEVYNGKIEHIIASKQFAKITSAVCEHYFAQAVLRCHMVFRCP